GKEVHPVPAYNNVDLTKLPLLHYRVKSVKGEGLTRETVPLAYCKGCDCKGKCDGPSCSCIRKHKKAIPPYDEDGILRGSHSVIYECNPACKCSKNCGNRVMQNGANI